MSVLDVMPVAAAARKLGLSYPWLRQLIERGDVLAVRDRTGRLYVHVDEVERLAARYAHRRTAAFSEPMR